MLLQSHSCAVYDDGQEHSACFVYIFQAYVHICEFGWSDTHQLRILIVLYILDKMCAVFRLVGLCK